MSIKTSSKKGFLSALTLQFALALPLSTPSLATPVHGEGIGTVSVGVSAATVGEMFGKHCDTIEEPVYERGTGLYFQLWQCGNSNDRSVVLGMESKTKRKLPTVRNVHLKGKTTYFTNRGITIGDSVARVLGTYIGDTQGPTVEKDPKTGKVMMIRIGEEYEPTQVTFTFDDHEKVSEIFFGIDAE